MCLTKDEIRDMLQDLPDSPCSLTPESEFYGIIDWKVKDGKGIMRSKRLLDEENAEIYHTQFNPGTVVDWHTHGESKEVITCLSGKLILFFEDGSQLTMNEKDIHIINKNVNHMAIIGNKPCQIIAMTIPKENGR